MQLPAANDSHVFVSLNIFEDMNFISHLYAIDPTKIKFNLRSLEKIKQTDAEDIITPKFIKYF
jgi:hypothetical protein